MECENRPQNEVFEMKGSRRRWKEAAQDQRKPFSGVFLVTVMAAPMNFRFCELWSCDWLNVWLNFFCTCEGCARSKRKKRKKDLPPPLLLSWTIERRLYDKVVWRHATSIHELTPRIRSSKRFGENNYESSNRKMAGCRKSVIGTKFSLSRC